MIRREAWAPYSAGAAGLGVMRGPGSALWDTGIWDAELTGGCVGNIRTVVMALSGFSK